MAAKQTLLTGLQPSGDLHIGNYFGALKPFVDAYADYNSYLMVADYHALTSVRNPETLCKGTLDVVRAYLAAGVDPEKAVIFRQSDVPEHTELAWIFDCVVTVPFLMNAHAYKDKTEKGLEANAGLFTYPMLMAADILLYDTDVVPVGEDQRQHIEYAREAAKKFNVAFCISDISVPSDKGLFRAPQELILEKVGVVPGTDGKKMSKSYGNTVPLFASKDKLTETVTSIVTNSGPIQGDWDVPNNVRAIHALVKDEAELSALYKEKAGRYKELKEALIEDLDAFFKDMRARYEEISDEKVIDVLKKGAAKARRRARAKMEAVRKAVGVR